MGIPIELMPQDSEKVIAPVVLRQDLRALLHQVGGEAYTGFARLPNVNAQYRKLRYCQVKYP